MERISKYISSLVKSSGLDQRDLALQAGMPFQNISAVLKGRRQLTLEQSVIFDDIFGLETGTIYRMQANHAIDSCRKGLLPSVRKMDILKKVKKNGGLWSYDGIPTSFSDDDIIEEGLRRLDFEDMHLLFELWSPSHVKRVWKDRLVSEGKRTNILNTLLGILFFGMGSEQINKYLLNYGPK